MKNIKVSNGKDKHLYMSCEGDCYRLVFVKLIHNGGIEYWKKHKDNSYQFTKKNKAGIPKILVTTIVLKEEGLGMIFRGLAALNQMENHDT